MLRSIVLVVVGLVACTARAQSTPVKHDAELWGLVTAEGRIQRPFLYALEAQQRVSLDAGGPYQTIARGAVGFAFTDWLSLWAGAAWIPTSSWDAGDVPFRVGEGRGFQQLLITVKPFGATLASRSRFEERAIEGVADVSLRSRTMLRLVVPVALEGSVYVAASDEIFGVFVDAEGGPQRGFDQNRAFVGGGWKLDAHTTMEGGYLNRATRDLKVDHALLVWLAFRFY